MVVAEQIQALVTSPIVPKALSRPDCHFSMQRSCRNPQSCFARARLRYRKEEVRLFAYSQVCMHKATEFFRKHQAILYQILAQSSFWHKQIDYFQLLRLVVFAASYQEGLHLHHDLSAQEAQRAIRVLRQSGSESFHSALSSDWIVD